MNVYSKFGLRYVSEEKENYLSGSSAVEALEASLLKLLCKKVCLPRRAQGGKKPYASFLFANRFDQKEHSGGRSWPV